MCTDLNCKLCPQSTQNPAQQYSQARIDYNCKLYVDEISTTKVFYALDYALELGNENIIKLVSENSSIDAINQALLSKVN